LFTYAFYSPKTKRVVHRQDVIFLTTVFPMRSACLASGLYPEGEPLVAYRSPPSVRNATPDELSFHDWTAARDPLPAFEDEVSDFDFVPPEFFQGEDSSLPGGGCDLSFPIHFPDHPGFGAVSAVGVPLRAMPDPGGLVSGDFCGCQPIPGLFRRENQL
jgi:hypothetical protein